MQCDWGFVRPLLLFAPFAFSSSCFSTCTVLSVFLQVGKWHRGAAKAGRLATYMSTPFSFLFLHLFFPLLEEPNIPLLEEGVAGARDQKRGAEEKKRPKTACRNARGRFSLPCKAARQIPVRGRHKSERFDHPSRSNQIQQLTVETERIRPDTPSIRPARYRSRILLVRSYYQHYQYQHYEHRIRGRPPGGRHGGRRRLRRSRRGRRREGDGDGGRGASPPRGSGAQSQSQSSCGSCRRRCCARQVRINTECEPTGRWLCAGWFSSCRSEFIY